MIENFKKIKGFLDHEEGKALYFYCKKYCKEGIAVEIGSYCGKSACYLGQACKENNSYLYSIDHHRGSEEQQLGEEYFDEEIYDYKKERVNTLPLFLKNIEKQNLKNSIKPLIMDSESASKIVEDGINMIFIDGSHTFKAARNDYKCWKDKIKIGGILAIHDVYDSESEGGQAPKEIFLKSLKDGFSLIKKIKSLVILEKLN
tara:strand:- start:14856 stop:15461 length:606 start_codon:yes stop_codon:yes gene_type:complete